MQAASVTIWTLDTKSIPKDDNHQAGLLFNRKGRPKYIILYLCIDSP